MSESQAGPSVSVSGTKRKPEPLSTERTSSLGRILNSTWSDKASPLYDCFDTALREQQASVAPWLAQQLSQTQKNALLKAAEARFDACLAVLRAAGSTYDPSTQAGAQAPLPPLNSPARAKAVEARRAWEDVTELRDEKKRFEGFLAGEADTMRNRAGRQLEAVRTAKTLHVQFLAIAWRRALRWRVLVYQQDTVTAHHVYELLDIVSIDNL
ncbi:hypothetical protein EIP86_004397 [Pleurotus ostreatoroseus]|nr:hypothetical protein EIP86_004397 [Pleurotus ostreatoroseus]